MGDLFRNTRRFVKRKLDAESWFFFKNSTWLLSSNIIRAAAVFLRSILIARGLGLDLYGTYLVVITFVATVQEFFNMQVGSAIIKFGAGYKSDEDRQAFTDLLQCGFLLNLLMAILSIGTVWGMALVAYDVFLEVPGLTPYLVIFAIGGGIKLLEQPCISILRLYYRFKVNALVSIAMAFVDLATIALTLNLYPADLTLLIVAVTAVSIVTTLVLLVSTFWELHRDVTLFRGLRPAAIAAEWRKIWRFVIGTSGSNTLKKFILKGDVLLLAALSTPAQVGFYGIAKKLASTIKVLTDPLANTIYPQIATLISERQLNAMRKMILNVTRLILVPFLAAIGVLVFWGADIIALAYGTDFMGASRPLLIVMGAVAVEAVLFWSISLLNGLGLVAVRFTIYAASAVVGFVLAWLLIPTYGAVGMAITLLVVNLLVQGGFVLAASRRMRKSYA